MPIPIEPKMPEVDLHDRFRKELHAQEFPRKIRLEGNQMHKEIAMRLLAKHAPHLEICEGGAPVLLFSLEAFGTRFLKTFLEGASPIACFTLLSTIPEQALIGYAERHGISVVREEKDPVREMVERISQDQPQTFFALRRSADRLKDLVGRMRTS